MSLIERQITLTQEACEQILEAEECREPVNADRNQVSAEELGKRLSYTAWAVSDLHGNYNLWRQVIESLGENEMLYVLGDCADRGEAGWRIIKEALRDPRVIYIRGNHDQMLLDAWKSGWTDLDLWFWNGGESTFNGIMEDDKAELYLQELNKSVYYALYKVGDKEIVLSHAGFTPPYLPNVEDLLWDREHIFDEWPDEDKYKNLYIVHGHSPVVSHSCFCGIDIQLNESKTVGKYADGHKIDIDGRTIISHKCAMLNLNTFEERIFTDEV